MLILNGRRFIEAPFKTEEELEHVVVENSESIFGPSSIFVSTKKLISTAQGTGTVPDGYVIDVASRTWFLVEAELARHSVWNHIAPQVAKQLIAARNPASRDLIVEMVVEKIRDEPDLMDRFTDEGIAEIDVRRELQKIIATEPVIGMPIDKVERDLRDWAETVKADVRLWIVRKYVEFGHSENVMYEVPEEYRPDLDTGDSEGETRMARHDTTVGDLIDAGLLTVGQVVRMTYKPRDGEQAVYEGKLLEGGSIEVLDEVFSSLSYAALYGMQKSGSRRPTVNGWTSWRTESGEQLDEVRERFLALGAAAPESRP